MKAIIHTEYGPPGVLQLAEVEKPTPKENEVLIQVRAASVNPLDYHYMRGTPYIVRTEAGLRKPKNPRLGTDMAGQVVAVGTNIAQFRVGDEVFGIRTGAFAEYVCKMEKTLAAKPANLTFEQAAAVPVAACTALQGLRNQGQVQPGQKVLINGAAGGVGTFAVQIAKAFGAHVTAVCSTKNLEMVRSIGADSSIDYTQQDFTQSAEHYDLICDVAGTHSLPDCLRVITPKGRLVLVGGPDNGRWLGPMTGPLKAAVLSRFVSQKLLSFLASVTKDDLIFLKGLIEAKKVTPVIDRTYRLSEVPEAIRYLEAGHAKGKVVITLEH